MNLPIGDWQFWVVTVIVIAAAGYIFREVLPFKLFKKKPKARAASLTIEGKSPKK